MEIERPFRIKIPSHKEPEKSNETSVNAPQKKPIHARFNDAFEDLQRYDAAAKDQNINPALIQKRCTEFEKEWTEKLDEARLNHCIQPMKDAVDAVRSEKTPDTSFANEDNMRPPLKITQEATRRLAQGMTRQEFERDI
jgi:hypothetical protein